ncbi:MAG: hypothetical protein IH936_01810 [Acidobacteria bacterium]|nr:hypothetical protein [Acidobacteriota bacterium]
MNFAEVPNTVMRSFSAKSNSAFASGWNGDPSYSIKVASEARPDTNQFHIIQPQVVK